jgi:hypothetical protein
VTAWSSTSLRVRQGRQAATEASEWNDMVHIMPYVDGTVRQLCVTQLGEREGLLRLHHVAEQKLFTFEMWATSVEQVRAPKIVDRNI